MANVTLTTAQNSGFVPQYWANRALEVLRANLMLARLVTKDTDFGPTDFARQGSTLTIGYPGTFSAQDKTQGTPVTPQAPSGGSDVQLTLSKHKVVPFLVEDFANAQANMNLMDRYINPAVVALAEQVETDLFSLYSGLTTSAIGTPGTGITGATIRTARETLNAARVPMAERSLVVSPSDEISILGDSTLATYFAYSQTQALKEGSIGRLYGFDLYMSQLVPVTAGSPNTNHNLAIQTESFLFATRPFEDVPDNAGVQIATAVDPPSGLSIRIAAQYDINNMGMRCNLDILYGFTTLRPAVGVVVQS